jgi:hypothetical protein
MNTQPAAPKTTYTSPKANSFSDKILRLELLAAKLAPLLDTMPYVQPMYTELTQLITDMKSHEFDSKGVKANFSQAVADGKAMMKKGDGLRSRLASALAFEHGPTSVLLTEFGLRPRSTGGGRKKGSPPPTPDPTPTPDPAPQPEVKAAKPAAVPAK